MADYDTKTIPILDDIIEEQETENDVVQQSDTVEPAKLAIQAEKKLDLFGGEPEQLISDDNNPETGAIVEIDDDQYDESLAVDFASDEFTALHSEISDEALDQDPDEEDSGTDFTADTYPAASGDIESTADAYSSEDQPSTFEPTSSMSPSALDDTGITSIETSTDTTVDTQAMVTPAVAGQSLEAVVDDIVKQLIPDLEQQLRFLVQQALEDRLSDAVLAQLGIKDKQS